MQQLLDARGIELSARHLKGITVSNAAGARVRKGQPLDEEPVMAFCARLDFMGELAAAMDADGSLPATSAARMRKGKSATSGRFNAHSLFADVHEAVRWRDEQFFKAYGTCVAISCDVHAG